MTQTNKKTVSDWTVIIFGSIGLLLGLSGLFFPESQYKILGLDTDSIGTVIPGLMGSAGLSATYVGLLYIFGTIQKWRYFKQYLIFARLLMAVGFLILMSIGRAPQTYVSAAIWEAAGAALIGMAIWWEGRRVNRK
ncbi:MAG TPA: hypothetical protein VEA58_02585 [Anaerovoracaceae bacterium]|nr:hypothetical protein [Flavobacterium sp.]HYE67469.1 hypothetical protein [Anaerovoracaceae bacterium]